MRRCSRVIRDQHRAACSDSLSVIQVRTGRSHGNACDAVIPVDARGVEAILPLSFSRFGIPCAYRPERVARAVPVSGARPAWPCQCSL